MSEKLYAISIVTGEYFPIEQEDVKVLYSYQIPLKSKPRSGCNKCYGRGYVSVDAKNGLHHLCTCLKVMDGYKAKELLIEMPRLQD